MSKNPEDGRCNLGVILETLTLRPAPNNLCHDRFCNLAPAVHLLCRRAVLPCKVPLFKTWSINHCGSQIRLGRLGQQFSSNLGRNHLQPSLEPGKNKQLGLKKKNGCFEVCKCFSFSIVAFSSSHGWFATVEAASTDRALFSSQTHQWAS